jgi:signal transduction histidine kinase/CheY-like chemotaxis protein
VNEEKPGSNEQRVLLRTMTGKDAALTKAVLERAGMTAHACGSVAELAKETERGAGTLLIAEEVLGDAAFRDVLATLQKQPPWSDLPVLILARTGADSIAVIDAMEMAANFTVIERPIRIFSLISSVRTALRARKRQYELRGVMQGLRLADQRKTEFLATLAHELRNPLAPLSTALALLQIRKLSPEAAQPHYVMMQRQVQHMVRLIDDLMEVSRITRGKIELRPEVLALEQVVADAVELSRPLLTGARHQLDLTLPDESLKVRGDRVRLTQVFSNLLNNAAKYTPAGGRIAATVERHDGAARIAIRDNGMGIPADMLAPIFEMFVQVTDTSSAAQGGLGIGLTLVKSLVELHGGTVRAYSAGSGAGSELVVTLPLLGAAVSADESYVPGADYGRVSGHILIVDDNREAADGLSAVLQAVGAETSVAYGGEEALVIAASVHPAVGILDIGMPGMDGCELARRLRSNPEHAHIFLIALTGWGQHDDRVRVDAAGFDHHLLKPVDIAELRALLQGREQAA